MEAEKLKKAVEPLANLADCGAYGCLKEAIGALETAVKNANEHLDDKDLKKSQRSSLAFAELDSGIARASTHIRVAAIRIAEMNSLLKIVSSLEIVNKNETEDKGE